ncbi:MAG: AraC family transcriptional regulator [Oscillospiraceae bacterium]|jgi:AraC-like DNA-binding protein|nr:AraC family transcriptional regulator [Oscillospiraceae bacterium]
MNFKNVFQIFQTEYIKSEYYKKVIKSFLFISCVILSVFSMFLLLSANSEYSEALESMQEQTITQAQYVNQTSIKDIYTHCYRIQQNSNMNKILYGDSFDPALNMEALEINKNFCISSSLIHSCYFINFRTGTVIDQSGRTDIDYHADSGIYEILGGLSPSRSPVFCYPRMCRRQRNNSYSEIPVLSIIFYENMSGAVVINLDYDAYRQMFSLKKDGHISTTMINANGQVILSSDSQIFGQDYSQDLLYLEVLGKGRNHGSFPFSSDGVNYSVSYIKNEGMGITYICTRENRLIYSDNKKIISLLKYTAGCLAIGLLLSLLLSWLLYNPLKQLKKSVAGVRASGIPSHSQAFPSPSKDFDYLSHIYKEISDMNDRLLQDRNAQQNTELFARLLRGAEIPASKLEALDADFPSKNYMVVLLELAPPLPGTELLMERELMRYAIQNVTQELLSEAANVHLVRIESAFSVFLLNFDTLDIKKALQAVENAQAFILKHFGAEFSAGLGDTVQDISELSQSYNSAFEALSQRFISGRGSVHTAEELRLTPSGAQIYPYETAQSLLAAVKAISRDDAQRFIHEFFASVRHFDIDKILSFVLQLHFSLQKLETENYIQISWDWDYKELEKRTLGEIEEQLCSRCLSDMEQLASIRDVSPNSSNRKDLKEQIQVLIEENIYKPELSVTFLADQVHLSVNYLRNIFKDSTGSSLSNYINNRKIDVICRLLLDTDMTLTEINDKLGFSTRNYFYTFFKKHIGMTPKDYRKKMRGSEQDHEPSESK